MARNILTTLKNEHGELRALFEKINDTTDRAEKTREQLLERIEELLVTHAKWEEQEFYPAFAERADRDGLKTYAEAMLEHSAIENTVLPQLKEAEYGSPEFAGRANVMSELVKHHVKEEESTMFSMARQMFSADELADLDDRYAEWKESGRASAALMGAKAKAGTKAAVGKLMGH